FCRARFTTDSTNVYEALITSGLGTAFCKKNGILLEALSPPVCTVPNSSAVLSIVGHILLFPLNLSRLILFSSKNN
ncbi:hypothetical protein, partial [Escherichia coli]|uniref:hypothetical protein n=1 Tax=Escherichia coli TaxID=562 RepID=UPI001C6FD53C